MFSFQRHSCYGSAVIHRHLPLDPRYQKIDDAALPLGGNLDPSWYTPPFRETVAATTGASMLRLEHGVSAHRRLLAVVRRVCGREARSDEILAMGADSLQPLLGNVFLVRLRQMESTAELRLHQPRKRRLVVLHPRSSRAHSKRRFFDAGNLARFQLCGSVASSQFQFQIPPPSTPFIAFA